MSARPAAGSPPAHRSAPWPHPEAVMARADGENFPVASVVLGPSTRRHLRALYGFARLVDELGDEHRGDRLAALDELEIELDRAYRGAATEPLMRALAPTLAECRLPREPFARLIEANRTDQRVARYETWDELLGYCTLSANPVGELVLGVFGLATADRVALSDDVCTALQLVEHWQDVGEDARRGRIYLPAEDLRRFGCDEAALRAASSSETLRALLAFECGRTRALLRRGAALVPTLGGRPRLAVAAFVGGGAAALDALTRGRYEVLAAAPRASRGAVLRAAACVLAGATP